MGDPESPDPKSIIRELIEISEKDKKRASEWLGRYQINFAPYFKESVLRMSSMEAIRLENLPPSILDRYSNTDRSLFLVTVFPADNIWKDAAFLKRFVEDLERVDENATGNVNHNVTGQATSNLSGLIYMPGHDLNFSGGSATSGVMIIADELQLSGQANFGNLGVIPEFANQDELIVRMGE